MNRHAPREGCLFDPSKRGPLPGSEYDALKTGGVALLHPRLFKNTPIGVQEEKPHAEV